MTQKDRAVSVPKLTETFMIEIRLIMIKNVNIFIICESLLKS